MRHSTSSRPGPASDRANLYDEITDRIIAELEAGRLPRVQPWGSSGVAAPLAMPRNAATGRQYSGVDILILWGATVARGFSCQSWLTFRQALSLGGCVRKASAAPPSSTRIASCPTTNAGVRARPAMTRRRSRS